MEPVPFSDLPDSTGPPGAVKVTRVMLVANAVVLLLIAAAIYLLEGQDAEALGRAFVPVTPAVLNLAFAFPLIVGPRHAL